MKRQRQDPHQLEIDWCNSARSTGSAAAPQGILDPLSLAVTEAAPAPLVQRLPWDFRSSFPQPTDEAIDGGVLDESDRLPDNLKALHEAYAAQCLATLAALDKVLDARRRGVDPGTGSKPRTHAARERLRKYLIEEPARLEHRFDVLMDTYADAFGRGAGDAFRKAIHAWRAGVEVIGENRTGESVAAPVASGRASRASSSLPVPRPLRASVTAGVFGRDENGRSISPGADEVRAITEQQAERMIDMDDAELQAAATKYAEDFGDGAAGRLERYVRRQQRTR